jgi:hypothetical protein
MPLVRLVADRTLDVGVTRNGKDALDLRVTRLAALRNVRGLRVVGLMTRDARLHRVMGVGDYLRKTGGT